MRKRGQLSVIIIMGLTILIGVVILFALRQAQPGQMPAHAGRLESQKSALSLQVDACLESTVRRGIDAEGIAEPGPLQDFINGNLYPCVNLNPYRSMGITAVKGYPLHSAVSITPDAVHALVDWNLTLSQADSAITVSRFTVEVPRVKNQIVPLVDSKTTAPASITSSDNNLELSIPRGTQVLRQDGTAIPAAQIRIRLTALTRPDDTVYGYRTYTLEPAGIAFAPSAQIKITYTDEGLGADERSLVIVRREGSAELWKTIPTQIYPDENIAIGELSGFSEVALSLTCANAQAKAKVQIDTGLMYASACQPCACGTQDTDTGALYFKDISGPDGKCSEQGTSPNMNRCGSTNTSHVAHYDQFELLSPIGGTTSYTPYSAIPEKSTVIQKLIAKCQQGCDKNPLQPACALSCTMLNDDTAGCISYDFDGDGEKEYGYPSQEAAGGNGTFTITLPGNGSCIDTVAVTGIVVKDRVTALDFVDGRGNTTDLLTSLNFTHQQIRDGIEPKSLTQSLSSAETTTHLIKNLVTKGTNTFRISVKNLNGTCAGGRMLFSVEGAGLRCQPLPNDTSSRCCNVDASNPTSCSLPTSVADSTDYLAGLPRDDPRCVSQPTSSAPLCEGLPNLCAVFQRPNILLSTGSACVGGDCCSAADTISCCVKDTKLVFVAQSPSPYAWIVGKLNGKENRGIPTDRLTGSENPLMGKTQNGYYWAWEYELSTLKQGTGSSGLNIFSVLKDADGNTLDRDTKKCLRSAIYNENGVIKPVDTSFAFPPEEISAAEIKRATLNPARSSIFGEARTIPADMFADNPLCTPLSDGIECTERCNYAKSCDPATASRKSSVYCGTDKGICVQCLHDVTLPDGRQLGCEPGITCDPEHNWCQATHYHQEYFRNEWVTLLGDACATDSDCAQKFTDSWQRTCAPDTGICVDHCAAKGGNAACQAHYSTLSGDWACDTTLDTCIKDGNTKTSVYNTLQIPGQGIPGKASGFGLNIDPANPRGAPSIDELRELGVTWLRIEFKAEEGLGFYRQAVSAYHDAGFKILLILDYSSASASFRPGQVSSDFRQQFAKDAVAIGTGLKGSVDAFEIWNEEDGDQWSVPPNQYVPLLIDTAQAMRNNGIKSPLVIGGMVSGGTHYLSQITEAIPYYDAVGVHPYGKGCGDAWAGSTGSQEVLDNYLTQSLSYGKPLWITEIGVDTSDQNLQANYLECIYSHMGKTYGSSIPLVFWFAYSDGMVNGFGLVGSGGQKKLQYTAYANMAPNSNVG